MFAILLKLTPAFIFALPGVVAIALFPKQQEPRYIFVTIMSDLLPTGVRGYVCSALFGTIIAALIAVMNSVATMAVRDFFLHFRPQTSERKQLYLGRLVMLVCAVLGVGAAYLVLTQSEGIYKYLQTISIWLVMPIAPAIIFGILSKRVTFAGAAASVFAGIGLTVLYFVDFIIKVPETAPRFAASWFHDPTYVFPWLHQPLTANYLYRGAWGTP